MARTKLLCPNAARCWSLKTDCAHFQHLDFSLLRGTNGLRVKTKGWSHTWVYTTVMLFGCACRGSSVSKHSPSRPFCFFLRWWCYKELLPLSDHVWWLKQNQSSGQGWWDPSSTEVAETKKISIVANRIWGKVIVLITWSPHILECWGHHTVIEIL